MNNADEGVGRGPGGLPHIKLVHERPMQITVHGFQ